MSQLSSPKASLGWLGAGLLLCSPSTVGLQQCCQCAGVAFEDLAEIVCPSDPPGAEGLSWAKAFFLVLEKQG